MDVEADEGRGRTALFRDLGPGPPGTRRGGVHDGGRARVHGQRAGDRLPDGPLHLHPHAADRHPGRRGVDVAGHDDGAPADAVAAPEDRRVPAGWWLAPGGVVAGEELLMGVLPATLTREGFMLLSTTAGPIFGVLLVFGLCVGIFQAATQINDPAVGFLPRFAVAVLAVWLLGGWVLERYSAFFAHSLERMPGK